MSSASPEQYGNLPSAKTRVDSDDEHLYLTVLPDSENNCGRSNPAFDKNLRLPDSSTNSPTLYGNLEQNGGVATEDELHWTVLPDSDLADQPTYEILPKNS